MDWEVAFVISEGVLNLVGAFIGFSVARIAKQGYRETGSPTLLRLMVAFAFLGSGLGITGISTLIDLSVLHSISVIALAFSAMFVIATFLETTGYFFLAFSHGINARSAGKGIVLTPLIMTPVSAASGLLKSLSVVFLLYGVVETIMSYSVYKKRQTLLIGFALASIAVGELIRWVSIFSPGVSLVLLVSVGFKVAGLFMLYTPVMEFSSFKGLQEYAKL